MTPTISITHHLTPTLCRVLCVGSPRIVVEIEAEEIASVQLTIVEAERLMGELFMEIAAAKQAYVEVVEGMEG